MRETIRNWEGTDADLLDELNKPQHKRRVAGRVSLESMQDESYSLTADFCAAVEAKISALEAGDDDAKADACRLKGNYTRFQIADLDFENNKVANEFHAILKDAGWGVKKIRRVLDLSFVLESTAQRELNREATQDDLDAERKAINADALLGDWAAVDGAIQSAIAGGDKPALIAALQSAIDSLEG